MVLVCALILTIPFGFFGYFNTEFFVDFKEAINACNDVYTEEEFNLRYTIEKNGILNEIATCIMSSLSALIMAVLYYLFKPDPFEMEVFMRRNGNILLCMLHSLAITYSLLLTHSLTHYYLLTITYSLTHIVCMVFLTTAAIFSLMASTLNLFAYIALPEDFCEYNRAGHVNKYYAGGLMAVVVTTSLTLALMNWIG